MSATGGRVAVLGTRYADLDVEAAVWAGHDVEAVRGWGGDSEEIVAVAGDADVIVAGSAPRFDAAVLARLSCRGIVRAGAGVETVDLDAARDQGIWVARVPDASTEAVAQHALALALAGVRRLGEADRLVRAGGWGLADLRPLRLPPSLTAGVVGLGRIGRRVAELLAAVGFRVVGHDPYVESVPGAAPPDRPAPAARGAAGPHASAGGGIELLSLTALLEVADVVTLHAPGAEDGRPLLGAGELASMRRESVLVNTARGSLIDLDALAVALGREAPRVAALDVFPDEPPDLGPLAAVADRLILSPHAAWYSVESELALRRGAAEEALRLLRGERPVELVVEPDAAVAR